MTAIQQLSQNDLKALREKLEDQRRGFQETAAALQKELAELSVATAEEDGSGTHLADVGTDMARQEVLQDELERTQGQLDRVESALERMARGVYGACLRCGKSIPVNRLYAFPAAERDVACEQAFRRQAPVLALAPKAFPAQAAEGSEEPESAEGIDLEAAVGPPRQAGEEGRGPRAPKTARRKRG
jgi:DnaK suppressor protein